MNKINNLSMGLDENRQRRLKATGKWFQPSKQNKNLWLNYIFLVVLVVGFIFYVVNL